MGNSCCWKTQDSPRLHEKVYEKFIFNDPPTPRNTSHMATGTVCMPPPPPQRETTGRTPLWQPPAQPPAQPTSDPVEKEKKNTL